MNEDELRHLTEPQPEETPVQTIKNLLNPQPQPQPTGTQVIEKATNDGLQAKRQPFDWNVTSTQRPLLFFLQQAKKNYSAFDKAYQEAIQKQNYLATLENNPELRQQYMTSQGLNEAQFNDFLNKQKANVAANLEQIQQDKNIAHTDAEYIRDLARRRGLTDEQLGYFGSDVTLEEANRALANNDLNAIFNLRDKYQMNSDDYYEKMYSEYREQGMSPPRAAMFASDAAAKYKAERLAALGDGLSLYGRTNGALNDTGIDILSRMAQDNPEATNINLNAYAKPQDEYNNNFKYQMAQAMHAMGLEDKQIAAMLNMDLEQVRQNFQAQQNAIKQAWEETKYNTDREDKYNLKYIDHKHAFDLAEFQSALRVQEKKLEDLAKSGKIDKEDYQKQKDRYERIKGEYKIAIESGDVETAAQKLEELKKMGEVLNTYTDPKNNVEIEFKGGDAKEDYDKIAEMLSAGFKDQPIIDYLTQIYGRDTAMMMFAKVQKQMKQMKR